jgi:hypothetical protein
MHDNLWSDIKIGDLLGYAMARIYEQTILKWAKSIGLPAGTIGSVIVLYILYSIFVGDITVTGYTGDMKCWGADMNNDGSMFYSNWTPQKYKGEYEACFFVVNFTANRDSFWYPINYDPWGRNDSFMFNPSVKSWKIYRSWGKGWREIPMTISCTGTWCGSPDNTGTQKYSVAWRDTRSYTVMVVAEKNSPKDTIKWAFDRVDPLWLSALSDISNEYPYEIIKSSNINFDRKKEITLNSIKYSNNSNIIFSSDSMHSCTYYPSGHPKEAFKHCNITVDIENTRAVAIMVNSLNIKFTGLEKYNPVYYYSTTYDTGYLEFPFYNETDNSILNVTYVERRNYRNYLPLTGVNSLTLRNLSLMAEFDMPRYIGAKFNVTFAGSLGVTPITFDLDPEISECGTLSANSYYTQVGQVNSTGTCYTTSGNDNIVLDCQNNVINYSTAGTANFWGVFLGAGSTNITIKNCIIIDGNWSSTAARQAIQISENSTTIFNNTIITNTGNGITVSSMYNNISHNTITTSGGDGITIGALSHNLAEYNTINTTEITSSTPYGIYLASGSTNNTITNNYIWAGGASGGDAALYLTNSDDNIIINNTIISSSAGYTVFLLAGSQRNYFYNNTIIHRAAILALDVITGSSENVFDKIYVESSSGSQTALFAGTQGIIINNSVFNNTANGYALDFSTQSGNSTVENTLLKGTNDYGLHLQNINGIDAAGANNSLFRNVEIISETINGIYFNSNVTYGRFIGLNVTSGSDDYAILFTGMNHTRFEDSVFKGFAASDMRIDYPLVNLSFINCTYTIIAPVGTWGPGNSETYWTREWWWRGYAKDTAGNPLSGAFIEIYNSTGHLQNNMTTGADGYTARMNLMEYRANNSLKFFYASPYTFNASKGGYTDADIQGWNWTTNNMTFEFMLAGGAPAGDSVAPVVTLYSPPDQNKTNSTNITVSFVCNVTDNLNVTNVTLYHNQTSWHANITNTTPINGTATTFSVGAFTNGTYLWICRACDNSSNCAYAAANRTFEVGYNVAAVASTCACSSIQAGTAINCAENCTITACNANGQDIVITGFGRIIVTGDVVNYGKLSIKGVSSSSTCNVRCTTGCFKQ